MDKVRQNNPIDQILELINKDTKKKKWTACRADQNTDHLFPHRDEIESLRKIDADYLSFLLLQTPLAVRDTAILVQGRYLRWSHLRDLKSKDMKRIEEKEDFLVNEISGARTSDAKISKNFLQKINGDLIIKSEKALGGLAIAKGTLTSLIWLLNQHLIEGDEQHPKKFYRFEKQSIRSSYITDWINWVFEKRYRTKASFSSEQIRQLIKNSKENPSPWHPIPDFYQKN